MPLLPHTSRISLPAAAGRYICKKERLWRRQNRFESPPKLNRPEAKLKIFISLESPQESELPAKIFHDDMYRSIIEGTGEQRRKKL